MTKQQKIAGKLAEFVQSQGAHVVSVPGTFPMRVEAPLNSTLPAALAAFGYDVSHCGQTTRLEPGGTVEIVSEAGKRVERRHAGMVPVAVYSVAAPNPDAR